jgi:hypothetical protein
LYNKAGCNALKINNKYLTLAISLLLLDIIIWTYVLLMIPPLILDEIHILRRKVQLWQSIGVHPRYSG